MSVASLSLPAIAESERRLCVTSSPALHLRASAAVGSAVRAETSAFILTITPSEPCGHSSSAARRRARPVASERPRPPAGAPKADASRSMAC